MKRAIFLGAMLLASSQAWAAPDGAKLYASHCAVCHGDAGGGGMGLPLAQRSLMSVVDNNYLTTTIRIGRPGRIMPAFEQLSDAQTKAIVDFVRSLAGVPEPEISAKPIKGDAKRGQTLFQKNCASCHGDKGQGGHGTGVTFSRPRDLPITPPALNNPGYQAAAKDEMIKRILMQGLEGTPMRSFLKAGLKEKDINDIVSYVRTFQTAPDNEKIEHQSPVLVADSPYTLEETMENLRQAAIGKNFRLIREQYLEDGLLPEEQQNKRQIIFYFCNFSFLNDALNIDPRVGLFLPCRITVTEVKGKVQLRVINPLRLSALFNNAELDQACHEMHKVYQDLLDDATL